MSLVCSIDCEFYTDLSEELVVSKEDLVCIECEQPIKAGVGYYDGENYECDEYGEQNILDTFVICEECGDLLLSLFELGYCWSCGGLRDTIKEMNDNEALLSR